MRRSDCCKLRRARPLSPCTARRTCLVLQSTPLLLIGKEERRRRCLRGGAGSCRRVRRWVGAVRGPQRAEARSCRRIWLLCRGGTSGTGKTKASEHAGTRGKKGEHPTPDRKRRLPSSTEPCKQSAHTARLSEKVDAAQQHAERVRLQVKRGWARIGREALVHDDAACAGHAHGHISTCTPNGGGLAVGRALTTSALPYRLREGRSRRNLVSWATALRSGKPPHWPRKHTAGWVTTKPTMSSKRRCPMEGASGSANALCALAGRPPRSFRAPAARIGERAALGEDVPILTCGHTDAGMRRHTHPGCVHGWARVSRGTLL